MNSFIEERILAIDYGNKRIGLALTDPLKIFAYPFKTIPNNEKIIDEIVSIIKEYNVKKIILGYPLREDGQKSEICLVVEKFLDKLMHKTNIEILLKDERYTSEMAKINVIESVKKKMKRRDKGLIDQNAASIILKEYLEETKDSK